MFWGGRADPWVEHIRKKESKIKWENGGNKETQEEGTNRGTQEEEAGSVDYAKGRHVTAEHHN